MKPITHGITRLMVGAGLLLFAATAAQAQVNVSFQVDMASVSPAPTSVYISGSFNGWPGFSGGLGDPAAALINVSGTIWSNSMSVADAPGTIESCKFQYEAGDNWESIPNRQFVVPAADEVLPLTSWNVNTTWPTPTNDVTFQIDLSPEVYTGGFTNGGTGSITVAGDFEGWDAGQVLTNNPTTGDYTSNYYSGTFPIKGFPGGTTANYKFRMNGGWESPTSTGGNNRQAAINSSSQVLPLVYYQDNTIYDLTPPIEVKFSVVITNGEVDNAGIPFVKGVDTVYINGDFLGWYPWNGGTGGMPPAAQMFEEGTGTDVYTNSFLIPGGNSLTLNYKYSMDGYDNENGFQTNHVRVIRSYPPNYAFPQDVWSWSIQPPSATLPTIVEKDYGNLAIGGPSGGYLTVSWLGRKGVLLQNAGSLNGGVWTSILATDAAQGYSWPNTGEQFFRLMKKAPAPGSPPNTW